MIPLSSKEAAKPKERESDILRTCLDYLAAERIWHMRCNSGAFVLGEGKSRRFFRAAKPGCADVLVVRPYRIRGHVESIADVQSFTVKTYSEGQAIDSPIFWLEMKTQRGKQSSDQIEFQREVTEQGMKYAVIRSLEDLKAVLG